MRRILLVDDHPAIRDAVRNIIQESHDLTVCGETASAQETLDFLNENERPDIVVLDLSLPGMSGLDILKQLGALHPTLPVLVFSAHDEAVYAVRVLRAGARGYLSKHSTVLEVLDAIRSVLRGEQAVSVPVQEQLALLASGTQCGSPMEQLSDRELEVFQHIGYGRSTASIADAMCVSPKTIESHRLNIKRKLNVQTANELVQRAALWVAARGVPTAF